MTKRRLVVIAPGIAKGQATWNALVARLETEPALAGAHWLRWEHTGSWVSRARARDIARELRATIDAKWSEQQYDEIILLGHSLGGLLVRQAFLFASGSDGNPPERAPWAAKVTRIVLFAALNRGANGLTPEGPGALALRAANLAFRILPPLRRFLVYDLMRGGDFLTNLRLQWIRAFDSLGAAAPTVVQVLGRNDWLVKRDDSLDVEQFRTAWHLDMPGARHATVHRLDAADGVGADLKYSLIRSAILDDRPRNAENRPSERGPQKVVFVLHGIRASNRTWAEDLRQQIRVDDASVVTITPSYGFLSAIRFAIPMSRRKPLSWFQDQYSQVIARNPDADVSFVGHSNGTYVFGESLKAIPGMRFSRAVLVGSVLPTDYDWSSRVAANQIKWLRNVRSNRDFPVSFLCSGLRGLRMRDVGPGGFEGFHSPVPQVTEEIFWFDGGHSAPLERQYIPWLASLILKREEGPVGTVREASRRYDAYPRLAPRIVQLVALLIVTLVPYRVVLADGFDLGRLGIALGVGALVFLIADLA